MNFSVVWLLSSFRLGDPSVRKGFPLSLVLRDAAGEMNRPESTSGCFIAHAICRAVISEHPTREHNRGRF